MKTVNKILLIVFLFSVIFLLLSALYYFNFLKTPPTKKNLNSSYDQSISQQGNTTTKQDSYLGFRAKELYIISNTKVESLINNTIPTELNDSPSLGEVLAGRFKELKNNNFILTQGQKETDILISSSLTLYIKVENKVSIVPISLEKKDGFDKFNQNIRQNDLLLIINETKNNF